MTNPEELIDWKNVASLSEASPQRKAAVTRACTKVAKLVARPYNFLSPNQIEKAQNELEQAFDLLQNITYRISDISSEPVPDDLKSVGDYEAKYEEALDKLASYIDDDSRANQSQTSQATSNSPVHVDKLLFPRPITLFSHPRRIPSLEEHIRTFPHQWKCRHGPTNHPASIPLSLPEPELQKSLTQKINEPTPVSCANGCLQILESEFHFLYPTLTRHMEFFQATHAPQDDPISYLKKLDSLKIEADIESLDHDGITVFKFLSTCGDDDLRKKIFDSKVDTLPHIKELVRQHTAQLCSIESIKEQTKVIAPVSRTHPKRQNQPEHSSRASRQGQPNSRPDMAGRCGHCGCCGRTKHKEGDVCFVIAENLCCDKCGKAGHIAPVCRSEVHKHRVGKNIRRATDAHPNDREEDEVTPRLPLSISHRNGSFPFTCFPDTGSATTLLSSDIALKHEIPVKRPTPSTQLCLRQRWSSADRWSCWNCAPGPINAYKDVSCHVPGNQGWDYCWL